MTEQVSPDDIPSMLERLVDSWYAVGVAEELRGQFERSVERPAPLPGGFDEVSALQEYHRRVVDFQTRQAEMESTVNEASRNYENAAKEVGRFLPSETPCALPTPESARRQAKRVSLSAMRLVGKSLSRTG
jgi:hypothetical protein